MFFLRKSTLHKVIPKFIITVYIYGKVLQPSKMYLEQKKVSWMTDCFFFHRWDDDVVFKNCAKDDDKPSVSVICLMLVFVVDILTDTVVFWTVEVCCR